MHVLYLRALSSARRSADLMLGLSLKATADASCQASVQLHAAASPRCLLQLHRPVLHSRRMLSVCTAEPSRANTPQAGSGALRLLINEQNSVRPNPPQQSNPEQQGPAATQNTVSSSSTVAGQDASSVAPKSLASSHDHSNHGSSSARNRATTKKTPRPRQSTRSQAPEDESLQATARTKQGQTSSQKSDAPQSTGGGAATETTAASSDPALSPSEAGEPAAGGMATAAAAAAGMSPAPPPAQPSKAAAAGQGRPTRSSSSSYSQPASRDMTFDDIIKETALQPPEPLPSPAAVAELWCDCLGIDRDTLEQWHAGVATVLHPETGNQVQVLALPYYRGGQLVQMRYLHIESWPGMQPYLAGTWLARKARREMYMLEDKVKGSSSVVFVSCELEAMLLSAADIAAIALPQQSPIWLTPHPSQQQPQQQYQTPPLPQRVDVIKQLLHLRAKQHDRRLRQHPEDPRLRIQGVVNELNHLQRQDELGTLEQEHSSDSSSTDQQQPGGSVISKGSQRARTGLQLLLGVNSSVTADAVIAFNEGPGADAAGSELAALLPEASCRQIVWPVSTPLQEVAALAESKKEALKAMSPAGEQLLKLQQDDDFFTKLQEVLQHAEREASVRSMWDLLLLNALLGMDAVYSAVSSAIVWPIAGLERFSDYTMDILTYYNTSSMDQIAVSTGWSCLDEFYKVSPGEVTLVTGVPNSGKSEWLDALAVNLAEEHDWRFAVCSMEKRPRDHARQLLEKHARKPLLTASYAEDAQRMSEQELAAAYQWLCDHFYVIASGEGSMPSIAWVMEKAKAAKILYGIDGLIIDPYNELDPTRSNGLKEHEHVNELMGMLRKFARDNKVHCWLVAHPRQMNNMWQGQRPGLMDISGGANFMNKTDNGIVVHRDWSRLKELKQRAAAASGQASKRGSSKGSSEVVAAEDSAEQQQQSQSAEFEVQIIVEKVRNKTTGCKGQCVLVYDRVTGKYREQGEQPDRGSQQDGYGYVTDENAQYLEVEALSTECGDAAGESQLPDQGGGFGGGTQEQTDVELLEQKKELVSDARYS